MMPASGKFGLNRYATSAGSLGFFDVDDTQTAKFVVTNAAPGNIFTIKGKIQGQDNYVPVDTIIGNITKTIDITQYDYIEVECTTYSSQSTYVQIDGSGFATSLINSPMGDLNLTISLNPGEDGVYIGDKTTGVPLKVNNDGSINVNASITGGGDATAANQVIANNLLTSIDNKQDNIVTAINDLQASMVSFVPSDFDDMTIDRDLEDDPIFYNFFKSASLIAKVEVIYNTNKSAIRYRKV